MKTSKRFISLIITVMMIASLFTVMASVSAADPAIAKVNYTDETIDFTYENNKFESVIYFYALKVKGTATAADESKMKWFPVYGTSLNISSLIPKKAVAEADIASKGYHIAVRKAVDVYDATNGYSSLLLLYVKGRDDGKKTFINTDKKPLVSFDPKTEKLVTDAACPGFEYQVTTLGIWQEYDETTGLKISADQLPGGAAINVRTTASDVAKNEKPASGIYSVKIAAQPKAPKITFKKDTKGYSLTGIKLDGKQEILINGKWAAINADGTSKDAFAAIKTCKDFDASILEKGKIEAVDDAFVLKIRTMATEKVPASAVVEVLVPKDSFDDRSLSAALTGTKISGVKDTAITSSDLTLKLTNGVFNATATITKTNIVVTGLAAGLNYAVTRIDDDEIKVTVTGTPTAVAAEATIAVKILKAAIKDATADITATSTAKIEITTAVSNPTAALDKVYAINGLIEEAVATIPDTIITINVTGDTFKALDADSLVTAWITIDDDPEDSLSIVATVSETVAANANQIKIKLVATATEECGADIQIKIPANVLNKGIDIDVSGDISYNVAE